MLFSSHSIIKHMMRTGAKHEGLRAAKVGEYIDIKLRN